MTQDISKGCVQMSLKDTGVTATWQMSPQQMIIRRDTKTSTLLLVGLKRKKKDIQAAGGNCDI